MSYTINVDIEVHEVDHPVTPEEALHAARDHFGKTYDMKPIQNVIIPGRKGKDGEDIIVSVKTPMIKITEGIDPGVAPT